MIEEWRSCFGGHYEVSNCGRVRRVTPACATWPGRVLRARADRVGYLTVNLKACGSAGVTHLVHRLVAAAFIGPCPDGMQVNHKDGVKGNCASSNLEYVTPADNIRHAMRMGLRTAPTGTRNGHAKLTEEMVREARARRAQGEKNKDIAAAFGVNQATMSYAIIGKTWRCVA